MDIIIDLYRDWRQLVSSEVKRLSSLGFKFPTFEAWKIRQLAALAAQKEALSNQGSDASQVDTMAEENALLSGYDNALLFAYLDLQYRVPSTKKRRIERSSRFTCPAEHEEGLKLLEGAISDGKPLFPFLSRSIFDATEQDGMLFDWGILHFHLGTKPDPKHVNMLVGTKEILYAALTEEVAYFLVIADHGQWANRELLVLLKRDFPFLLEPFKLKGIMFGNDFTYSDKNHIALRRAGMMVPMEIDGELYISRGGGINSARGSASSVTTLQRVSYRLQVAERLLREQIEKAIISAHPRAEQLPDMLEFKMETYEQGKISVFDRSNGLEATVFEDKERRAFVSFKIGRVDGT